MPWTWSEIASDWLQGGRIAVGSEDVVEAFNRVEQHLGPGWIASSRIGVGGHVMSGPIPTLEVVRMGQRLRSIEGAVGMESLMQRLRKGESAADAELTAIYLVTLPRPDASIEIAPPVLVKGAKRVPDFRVRLEETEWTYVEVARPDASEAEDRVREVIQALLRPVKETKREFALEVFLRREPSKDEIAWIERRIPAFCSLEGKQREELGELGLLLLNHSVPGKAVLETPAGEENKPRLGAIESVSGGSEPTRHIVVRIPFSDDRAERFVTTEAKQLPKEFPGLLMFGKRDFKTWEPLLKRRFQAKIHTRVSAICLWRAGFDGTPTGEAWAPQTTLLLNPHARLPLPAWIAQSLGTWVH